MINTIFERKSVLFSKKCLINISLETLYFKLDIDLIIFSLNQTLKNRKTNISILFSDLNLKSEFMEKKTTTKNTVDIRVNITFFKSHRFFAKYQKKK